MNEIGHFNPPNKSISMENNQNENENDHAQPN